jgi:alanine racemase
MHSLLRCGESIGNYLRIQNQIKKFRDMCIWLKNSGVEYGIRHTACSASALTYPETIMDMVRFGIALYGWVLAEQRNADQTLTGNGREKHCSPEGSSKENPKDEEQGNEHKDRSPR